MHVKLTPRQMTAKKNMKKKGVANKQLLYRIDFANAATNEKIIRMHDVGHT